MSDLARWELRGSVRTFRTQFAEWNHETGDWWPLKNRFVATFRADGQLSELEHHNPDGSVSPVAVPMDGTTQEAELCRYDDQGRKTKVTFLPVPESGGATCSTGLCGTMYGVEGTDVAYSAPGATTRSTTYDEHDRPLEVAFHDANDALVGRVVFSRDQDGRVLSERMEFPGPGGLFGPAFDANVPADERASLMELLKTVFEDHTFSLATYTYDARGRRIETVRRMGKLSEERVTVRYDDFDNPVEEVRSDASREMRMDAGAVKSEEGPSHVQHARFEYQYDAHGNWAERVIWQRMEPNADERPSNIERRTFSYYE